MNTYAHIQIGKMITTAIRDTGIDLIKTTFFYGCVGPDYWPNHLIHAHNAPFCAQRISEETNILELTFSPPYSINAGILCHFICDYFCSVHNTKRGTERQRHVTYERKLDRFLKNHRYYYYAYASKQVDLVPYCSTSAGILCAVNDLKKKYENSIPSFKKDIQFAIQASLLVIINTARCAQKKRFASMQTVSHEARPAC